jgi:hypothetical protein
MTKPHPETVLLIEQEPLRIGGQWLLVSRYTTKHGLEDGPMPVVERSGRLEYLQRSRDWKNLQKKEL